MNSTLLGGSSAIYHRHNLHQPLKIQIIWFEL